MNRRTFIVAGVATLATPLAAEAQGRDKVPRIGHIMFLPRERLTSLIEALEGGLRDLGYVDGRNIIMEHRSAEGRPERLPEVAAELARLKVDVIVAGVNQGIAAAKHATSTIPIVMVHGSDPVGAGFISSLSRPGGNITGGTWDPSPELYGKVLELARETIPGLDRAAVLWDPGISGVAPYPTAVKAAADRLGVRVLRLDLSAQGDLKSTWAEIRRERVGAVVVSAGATTFFHRERIVSLAASSRLPTVFPYREFVELGGLMSYGPNIRQAWRRAAVYVDRILKGAKPGDLPVEQPTKFELVINLKTAKALGLRIPPSLLLRADAVIE
jgi:putative ABC transport system substrate-binding protein